MVEKSKFLSVIMQNDWRSSMRDSLNEAYKHRLMDDTACAICGKSDRPLAMHLIGYAQSETDPLPSGFVPQSASYGTIRGGFPVCDSCAPACSKCDMPIATSSVKEFYQQLQKDLHSSDSPVAWGNGKCEHLRLFGKWVL